MSRALHVHAWGEESAPRAVFLHGVTGHGGHARLLAEDWLEGYRVLAPDLLGHGVSPFEPPWSIDAHVEAILASLDREPADWIGHSFGGRLAFELAARRPDLVRRLVLLDPAIHLLPQIALFAGESARSDRSYVSFEEAVTRRYEESQLRNAPRPLVEEELRGHLVLDDDDRWRYRYCQAAVVAAYGEMASPPPAFEDARVPTLLVLGRYSYLSYDHLLDAHRGALGNLLTVVEVDGGHTVLWDAVEETGAAISAFLEA